MDAKSLEELLPLPPADFQLLMLLSDEPMHAYGISRAAEEEGGVTLEIGSLYRIIARMLRVGLIEEIAPDRSARGNEAKRKYYRITRLGRRVLRAEARRMTVALRAAAERSLIDLEGLVGGE